VMIVRPLTIPCSGSTYEGQDTPSTHPNRRIGDLPMSNFKVADLKLADKGRLRIEWAESRMPVLMALREKYKESKPFKGHRIAGCLHVTKETAVLIRTLRAAGAELSWSGCNPLSTQDDVAAPLAAEGTSIY